MFKAIKPAFGLVLTSFIAVSPAMADHYYDHHDHHDYNRYERNRDRHIRQEIRRDNAQARRWANWDAERAYYNSNWRRINAAQQRQYDAEMRRQWLAYHHNQWNGAYSWSNYNDPGFLNYLHNNNPSLMTRIGSIIGL